MKKKGKVRLQKRGKVKEGNDVSRFKHSGGRRVSKKGSTRAQAFARPHTKKKRGPDDQKRVHGPNKQRNRAFKSK